MTPYTTDELEQIDAFGNFSELMGKRVLKIEEYSDYQEAFVGVVVGADDFHVHVRYVTLEKRDGIQTETGRGVAAVSLLDESYTFFK